MPTPVQSGDRFFVVNFLPSGASTSHEVFDAFIDTLEAAGWTAVDHSDGSAVAAGRIALADAANANAWQRMAAPSGASEMVWQRGANDWEWRAWFAQDGYNADGAATTVPTPVSDHIQWIGTLGNFDTGGFGWTSGGSNNNRWHIMARNVAGPNGMFEWYLIGRQAGTGTGHRAACMMPVEDAPDGSIGDPDNFAWVLPTAIATGFSSALQWTTYLRRKLSGEALDVGMDAATYLGFPNNEPVNPYSGKKHFAPIIFRQTGAPGAQTKGRAETLFWPGVNDATHDTYNLTTDPSVDPPGPLILFDDVLLPWPQNVVPVV